MEDGADAVFALLQDAGIKQLAYLIGNSMGAMTAVSFLQRHPGIAKSLIDIVVAARALPYSIAIRSVQREAIKKGQPTRF